MDIHPYNRYRENITKQEVQIVTDADRFQLAYNKADVQSMLHKFAFAEPFDEHDPEIVTEDDIEESFIGYAIEIAETALKNGVVDFGAIRDAVDLVFDGMDTVRHEKFAPPEPRSMGRILLKKLGFISSPYVGKFYRLDDRYWQVQFPEEYKNQVGVTRHELKPENIYLAQQINRTLCSFALPSFSYIQQATRGY